MPDKLVLHLGFINTPYTAQSMAAPVKSAEAEFKRKRKRSFTRTQTAENVAQYLEAKYGIMDVFYAMYENEILGSIADVIRSEKIVQLMSNKRSFASERLVNAMRPKTRMIEALFRKFLDMEQGAGLIPGVPTKASLRRRGCRPSFVNTGIYRASFKPWVDIR